MHRSLLGVYLGVELLLFKGILVFAGSSVYFQLCRHQNGSVDTEKQMFQNKMDNQRSEVWGWELALIQANAYHSVETEQVLWLQISGSDWAE